jgi:glyoxylase-like metal-dependent hydrolase (beta-lactamase superfamily II)
VTRWDLDILIPAHRLVFALQDDEFVELKAPSTYGTFRSYRKLPDTVPAMIAWPNTVLLRGAENIVIDPGYQTQGDMLIGALESRGLEPDDIRTVVMTHLHSDHVTALPQLGDVELFVHEDEMENSHAGPYRGVRDHAEVRLLTGDEGEIRPGLRWIHTPGHSPGHIAIAVDTEDGLAVVAGDTPGPNPAWFAEMDLPDGFPDREQHLEAFERIRALDPVLMIPGHTPPVRLR